MHSLMNDPHAFCGMYIHFIVKLCLLLSADTVYIALFVTSNIQGDCELVMKCFHKFQDEVFNLGCRKYMEL